MHVKDKKMCAACIIRTKKSESHWQLLQILSIMLSTVKGGFGQNILTQLIEKLINFRDLYSFLNKIMWNFKCVKIFRKKWLFIEKYDELWDMFENRSKGYHHNSYIALRHSNGNGIEILTLWDCSHQNENLKSWYWWKWFWYAMLAI